MMKKRRWIWVLLFILAVILLGTLAAGWNVVLVRNYYRILEHAKDISDPEARSAPWLSLILGTLGFIGLLCGLILFFVRLLQEMRLSQRQAEFLATVSHELKTPLATLELSASLLRAGPLPEGESDRLWRLHDAELKRLKKEVETLLEAARWQSGFIPLDRKKMNLEAWLAQAISRWQEVLGSSAILLREGDPLECEVDLDPRYLGLITDNLLDNARKFSPEGPKVTIRTRLLPEAWELSVQDEGLGFPPEDADRIFRRFVRAKTGAQFAIPGSGLGLHLALSASKALKLSLSAASDGPGRGSTFTLRGKRGESRG